MTERLLAGDLVVMDPDAKNFEAKVVVDSPIKPPEHSVYVSDEAAKRLQYLWRTRSIIASRVHFIVICASAKKALLMHPTGRFVLVSTPETLTILERP